MGEKGIGKTILIRTFINKRSTKPQETLVDNYKGSITIKDRNYELSIWDLGGRTDNKKLRCLAIQRTDVFILCFSVNNIQSLKNLHIFCREIENVQAPILICGLRCDEISQIKNKEVQNFMKRYNIKELIYCSSVNKININRVFETAVLQFERKPEAKKRFFCCF